MKTARHLRLDPNERRRSTRWGGRTLAERFWSHVDKSGACWIWTARLNPKGYGSFGIGDQRTAPAHRVSWVLANGREIPDGLLVLHSRECVSRACVRPDHLRLGTQLENVADTVALGRYKNRWRPVGEARWNAKLTPDLVLELRALHAMGRGFCELGRRFGLSETCVRKAITGRTWGHVSADRLLARLEQLALSLAPSPTPIAVPEEPNR